MTVGVIEVLGGVYAVVASTLALIALMRHGGTGTAMPSLFFAAAGLISLVAGVRLFRHSPVGRRSSLILQAVQIPLVVTPLLHYSAFLLARLMIEWLNGSTQFTAEFGGEFFYRLEGGSEASPKLQFGINILALLLFLLLWRARSAPTTDLGTESG
jgi:hypothetical protein